MAADGVKAGSAYVEISADTSELRKGLGKSKKEMKQFAEASDVMREHNEQLSKSMGESAESAKVGAEAFQSLAGSMGLDVGFIGELGSMGDRFKNLTRELGGTTKGMIALNAAGMAFAVGAGAAIGIKLGELIGQTKKWNEQLERSKELAEFFENKGTATVKREQQRVDAIRETMSEEEKLADIDKELQQTRKNQMALITAEREAEGRLAGGLDTYEGESAAQWLFDTGDIRRAEKERIEGFKKERNEQAAREQELLNQKHKIMLDKEVKAAEERKKMIAAPLGEGIKAGTNSLMGGLKSLGSAAMEGSKKLKELKDSAEKSKEEYEKDRKERFKKINQDKLDDIDDKKKDLDWRRNRESRGEDFSMATSYGAGGLQLAFAKTDWDKMNHELNKQRNQILEDMKNGPQKGFR